MAALLFRCKVTADERRITALFTPPAWDDEKQRSSASCFLRAEQDRRFDCELVSSNTWNFRSPIAVASASTKHGKSRGLVPRRSSLAL